MTVAGRPLPFNKACELEDFSHPELIEVLRDVAAHKAGVLPGEFPRGVEHRKDWEVAMAVRTLGHLGALRPDSRILGVAAGSEDTIFYLTRHAHQVFATDRYLASEEWQPVAPLSMLLDPASVAPFEFDLDRLVVQHMDGRRLWFPDATFDGVFSSGSIEHFGEMPDIAAAAYEMGRVLKPGGVLTLSTEVRISGPEGGIGWPGLTVVFPVDHLRRYIIEASGLELVDELVTDVSDATRQFPRNLTAAIADHHARRAASPPGTPEFACWEFPHLVVEHEDYVFTSVHLALRKTDAYPVVPNEWARPSAATVAAIREYNRSIVGKATTPPPTPAVPAPVEPAAAAAGGGLGESWEERHRAVHDSLATVSRGSEEVQATRHSLAADVVTVRHQLDLIDDGRRAADEALRTIEVLAPTGLAGAGDRPAPSEGEERRTYARVTLAEGLAFDVAVEASLGDPVTQALMAGYTIDQHLVSLMLAMVKPGDRILDLGAHVGTFSLAASAAGVGALAVEASPINAALVRASAVRNRYSMLRVVEAAVSDEPGIVDFDAHGPWGHIATTATSVKVPAVTLDELLFEMAWLPVDFMKMDIEGSEILALRGMSGVLSRPDAPPMICESNGHTLWMYGYRTCDLLAQLSDLGYTSYMIEPGVLTPVEPGRIQPQTIVDYLALKRSPVGIRGWTVAPALSTDDRIGRIVADLASPNEHHRCFMARSLEEAEELWDAPQIGAALDRAVQDPHAEVQEAAGWWAARRGGSTSS